MFLDKSRNGTFLHSRAYLGYHKDRYPDSSLMIYLDEALIAIFPATIDEATLTSHRGLTYGGLIVGREFHASYALDTFKSIRLWSINQGLSRILYKPVPHIYHAIPSEEDLYAINLVGGRLFRRDLSTTICLADQYPYTKGRKAAVNKARSLGVTVSVSDDYYEFMAIEAEHLIAKHGVKPTHTALEISLLAQKFPNNIKLYGAYLEDTLLGGVILFITKTTCHAQYIGASVQGKKIGAIDICIDYIIKNVTSSNLWFDFGVSTTDSGRYLDENLNSNKESWGGRSIVYDQYEWIL